MARVWYVVMVMALCIVDAGYSANLLVNGGFENPSLFDGIFQGSNPPTNWFNVGDGGTWVWGVANLPNNASLGVPTEGQNVMYSGGGMMQYTATAITANTLYRLEVDVIPRNNYAGNGSSWGTPTIYLIFGVTPYYNNLVVTQFGAAEGAWTHLSLDFDSAKYAGYVGRTLYVALCAYSGDVFWDNAKLQIIPKVDAGVGRRIILPASANLDGTVSYPGALTTVWTKVSGPGTVTFGNANAVDTTASFSTVGLYTLRLTATTGDGMVISDTVNIKADPVGYIPSLKARWNFNGSTPLVDTVGGRVAVARGNAPAHFVNGMLDLSGNTTFSISATSSSWLSLPILDIMSALDTASTVEIWFTPTVSPGSGPLGYGYNTIFSAGQLSGPYTDWRIDLLPSGRGGLFHQTLGYFSTNGGDAIVGQEQHWVLTTDKVSQRVRMYQNGVLKAEASCSLAPADLAATRATLGGQNAETYDMLFCGRINEFRVWNYELSPLQVLVNHRCGPDSYDCVATCQEAVSTGYGKESDLNDDCYVNAKDFSQFASMWLDSFDSNGIKSVRHFGIFNGIGAISFSSVFYGYNSAVNRPTTGGYPAYNYSADVIRDTSAGLYRLYAGGRWLSWPNWPYGDGDHILLYNSSSGLGGTWSVPGSPVAWTGYEEGYPGKWYSGNYLEPEVIKVNGTYYLYSQVEIQPGQPIDIPAGQTAAQWCDRIQLFTSTDGVNWTRWSRTRGVVVNFDDPTHSSVGYEEMVYVPWDPDGRPYWMYTYANVNGVALGYVRIRSADPTTFDWQARESGINLSQIGNQIGYAKQAPGGPLFVRITFTITASGQSVPSLQFSRDGLVWYFSDGGEGPVELQGVTGYAPDNQNVYFLGISTLNGTGELEYLGNNRYRAIYVATTCSAPIAPNIYTSEMGAGQLIFQIRTPAEGDGDPDMNGDHSVDFKDFALFVLQWLECYDPASGTCDKPWLN